MSLSTGLRLQWFWLWCCSWWLGSAKSGEDGWCGRYIHSFLDIALHQRYITLSIIRSIVAASPGSDASLTPILTTKNGPINPGKLHVSLQAVREGKSALWGAAGAVVLIAYGFVPTAQPILNFGRIYAGEQSGIEHQICDALGMPLGSPSSC